MTEAVLQADEKEAETEKECVLSSGADTLQEKTHSDTYTTTLYKDSISQNEQDHVMEFDEMRVIEKVEITLDEVKAEIFQHLSDSKQSIFCNNGLPERLKHFMFRASYQSSKPIETLFIAMFGAASVGIGNTRELSIDESWKAKAIVFIASIGEASSGKTPMINAAISPIRKYQRKLNQKYKQELLEYEQNLADYEADAPNRRKKNYPIEKLVPKPKLPTRACVYVQDATIEALREVFDNNKRGSLIHQDELAGGFKGFNQYKGGKGNDVESFLKMFNGDDISVKRVGIDWFIEDPYASIVGGLQTGTANVLFNEQFDANGMAARFLVNLPATYYIERDMFKTITGYKESMEYYERLITVLLELEGTNRPLYVSKEAEQYFNSFRSHYEIMAIDKSIPETWRAAYGKFITYGLRLSIIIQGLKYADAMIDFENGVIDYRPHFNEIDADTALYVWGILIPYFEKELESILKEQELTGDEKITKVILDKIDGLEKNDKILFTDDGEKAVLLSELQNTQPFGRQTKRKTKTDLEFFSLRNPDFCRIETCIPEGKVRNGNYFILNKNYKAESEI